MAGKDILSSMKNITRLLAVSEIARAHDFLGKPLTSDQREQYMNEGYSQLVTEAQLATSAVNLRVAIEIAEATRKAINTNELATVARTHLKS